MLAAPWPSTSASMPTRCASVLAGDRFAEAVREDERLARALGIDGVPFFVVDGRYGISGAQPSELIASALAQAWREQAA